jgi:Zn-dependent protease
MDERQDGRDPVVHDPEVWIAAERSASPSSGATLEVTWWPGGPPPPPPEHTVPPGWGAQPPRDGATPLWPPEAPATGPDTAPAYDPGAEMPPDPVVPRPARAGRPRASGCALGTVLVAVLSKLALAVKVLAPLLTALASFAAYAALFGWQFGVGILALLFVHEMGHFAVIRGKGLPASLPIFIPLLGAYVAMRRMPENVRDQAEIAVAGPLAGALGGAVCLFVYQQTDSRLWLVMAYFSFFINLVNLIPVSPLDGGRIVDAISRWFLLPGLALVVVAFYYTHSLLLLLLLALGGMQAWARFDGSTGQATYYHIPLLSRAYVTVLYFGLAAGLAMGMVAAQNLLVPGAGSPGW